MLLIGAFLIAHLHAINLRTIMTRSPRAPPPLPHWRRPPPLPQHVVEDDDEILCDCAWTRWPGQSCAETKGKDGFPCWRDCCAETKRT